MKPILRIALVSLIAACLVLVAVPRRASAHPMGNFTINQYSALTVGAGRVDILYVVDMAEIPAFQELGAIRADHGTNLTQAERDSYISRKSAEVVKGLSLSIDGRPLQLTVGKTALSFPPGAGNLPTLRFEMSLSASPAGTQGGMLEYRDDNYKERIGWKEIIARPAQGTSFESSSVPQADRSDALRTYSPDLLNSPPVITSASLTFAPGASGIQGTVQEQSNAAGNISWAQGRADDLTRLLAQDELPLVAFLTALAIAFLYGASHALSPGHGKTMVAAYLVGSRGTPLHAVLLGVTVTVSHTVGVFLVGLVALFGAKYILPEQLYPWLSFISGLLIAVMGVSIFVQRRRAWKRSGSSLRAATGGRPYTSHTHGEHTHAHAHSHDHGHSHDDPSVPHKHGLFSRPHTHIPADGRQVTLRNLLALGVAGGIIPCPSAVIVLLGAMYINRVALGLVLILAFSLGLAAVLTGIGLLTVLGRDMMSRVKLDSGLLGRLPMASALAVTCIGLALAYEALKSGGVLR